MVSEPEFNDYAIGEPYSITLPVYMWLQIGFFMQHVNDNTEIIFPQSANELIGSINDMTFPKAWQRSEDARIAQHREQHAQNHPVIQFMKGLSGHEDTFPFPPNPDDFNDSSPE